MKRWKNKMGEMLNLWNLVLGIENEKNISIPPFTPNQEEH